MPAFLLPWMAGMPGMQEQFPAMAMDGMYAGNEGAIPGDCMDEMRRTTLNPPPSRQRERGLRKEQFPAIALDGMYAGNARAIAGDAMDEMRCDAPPSPQPSPASGRGGWGRSNS